MKQILYFIKELSRMFPYSLLINFIARATLVSASILYLESIGRVSLFTNLIMQLWVLIPLYFSIRNAYYDWKFNSGQDERTLLKNILMVHFEESDKNSKERIIITKLRIWVENNHEINIWNYWYLKHLRKKEWMKINLLKRKKE